MKMKEYKQMGYHALVDDDSVVTMYKKQTTGTINIVQFDIDDADNEIGFVRLETDIAKAITLSEQHDRLKGMIS